MNDNLTTHDDVNGTQWAVKTKGEHVALTIIRPAKGSLPRELHFPLTPADASVIGRALVDAAVDAGAARVS